MDLSFLQETKTNKDRLVLEISEERPVLFVFLRHFGCVFCRASLIELAKQKEYFDQKNIHLVFFHMSDNSIADSYFNEYGLEDAEHVSDPETIIYQKFGLVKGNFNQLFGLKNWINGFDAVSKVGSISLKQIGDGFQMPGVFLFNKGVLEESFIHKYASDKPDYDKIINCCIS